MNPDSRNELINFVRIPALLIVVLIHSDITQSISSATAQEAHLFCAVVDFLQRNLFSVAVPLFYFISGYLFFRRGVPTVQEYLEKWKRRVGSLLVPYLLWNIIGLLLLLIKMLPALAPIFPQYSTLRLNLPTILEGFYLLPVADAVGPYDFVLWFIRNLIIIVILTPVIGYLFRYLRAGMLLLTAAAAWWCDFDYYSIATGMLYFSIGAWLALQNINIMKIADRVGVTVAVWATMIGVSYIFELKETCVLATVAGIFAFTGLCNLFLKHSPVTNLEGGLAFFIYACHGLYVTVVRNGVLAFVKPSGNLSCAFSYILIFTAEITLALLVYAILKRISPKLTSLLSGQR